MNDNAVTFTEAQLEEFDELIENVGSADQLDRISGRLLMNKFVAEHGKEKCDAMWAELEKRRARQ